MNTAHTAISTLSAAAQSEPALHLEVGQSLDSANSGETLQKIVERAAHLMDAQTCSLLLLDARRQTLQLAASYGLAPDTRAQKQLLGESVAGRVAQTQLPLLIGKSLPRDPRLQGIKLKAELGSAMLTPLKEAQDRVAGVLCVRRDAGHAEFTALEAHLFSSFAAQAVLALVNARLTEDLAGRAIALQQIASLARSLLAPLDLDAALQTALKELCRIVHCDRCCLYLREPGRAVYTPRHAHGYPEHIQRNSVKHGQGLVGHVAHTRASLCYDSAQSDGHQSDGHQCGLSTSNPSEADSAEFDTLQTGLSQFGSVRSDPDHAARQSKGFARSLGTDAFAALPLLTSRDTCLGVLVADNKSQRGCLTPGQFQLLQAFADHAALALENARLAEQVDDSAANLRGLKDYTDNVLQSIEAAILTTDAHGHVVRCNRAAEEMLQRPLRALRHLPLPDALATLRLPAEESEPLLHLVRQVQETGQRVHRLKLTLHPQDREPATVYLLVSRLPDHRAARRDAGSAPRPGVVLIFEDVTQEMRLEAEIEKMRRLADIGQLAAKMAHEVRNALTPIKYAAQTLRDDLLTCAASDSVCAASDSVCAASDSVCAASDSVCAASDSVCAASDSVCAASDSVCAASRDTTAASHKDAPANGLTEWPDMILDEVEGLSRLTSEMLNFARPMPLDPRPVVLNTLLRASTQALGAFLDAHRVRLKYQFDATEPTLQADPVQLAQVIRNLAMNAAQSMPDGGTLTLSSLRDSARREVVLRFEDTGGGIPPADLERVFQPFVTTRPKGTGLGLPIVQKIVDQHGGRLAVQSQVGTGTCFTVTLPLDPPTRPLGLKPQGPKIHDADDGIPPDN